MSGRSGPQAPAEGGGEPGPGDAVQAAGLTQGDNNGDTSHASVLFSFHLFSLKVRATNSFLPLLHILPVLSPQPQVLSVPPTHPAFLSPSTRFPDFRKASSPHPARPRPALPTGPTPRRLEPPAGWLPPWAAFSGQPRPDLPSDAPTCGVRPLEPAPVWLLPPQSPG